MLFNINLINSWQNLLWENQFLNLKKKKKNLKENRNKKENNKKNKILNLIIKWKKNLQNEVPYYLNETIYNIIITLNLYNI